MVAGGRNVCVGQGGKHLGESPSRGAAATWAGSSGGRAGKGWLRKAGRERSDGASKRQGHRAESNRQRGEAALTVTRGVVPLVGLCLKISTCGGLGNKLFGRHAALGRGGLALGGGLGEGRAVPFLGRVVLEGRPLGMSLEVGWGRVGQSAASRGVGHLERGEANDKVTGRSRTASVERPLSR